MKPKHDSDKPDDGEGWNGVAVPRTLGALAVRLDSHIRRGGKVPCR